MQQLLVYTANYTAAQTETDMPLANDPSVSIDASNHPLFPTQRKVLVAGALGNTLSRARYVTPRMRPIGRPCIRPLDQAATWSDPRRIAELFRSPLTVNPLEPLQVLVTNNAPVGGERNWVVLIVGDGNMAVPQGDTFTLRFTTAFTPTANAWSSGAITFDDTVAPGRYSVVGMNIFSTGLVAARLIFPDSQPRPGVIGDTAIGQYSNPDFRYGRLGELGQFESTALPNLDIFNSAATANPEGYLDLIKIR